MVEGLGNGETIGILDQQEDAADVVGGGDGAAGDDDEAGLELGDGNEAEVSVAGMELARAVGGRGVVDVVVRTKIGRGGRMLEVVEQGGRIQEGDGGDAKRHRLIVVGWMWE